LTELRKWFEDICSRLDTYSRWMWRTDRQTPATTSIPRLGGASCGKKEWATTGDVTRHNRCDVWYRRSDDVSRRRSAVTVCQYATTERSSTRCDFGATHDHSGTSPDQPVCYLCTLSRSDRPCAVGDDLVYPVVRSRFVVATDFESTAIRPCCVQSPTGVTTGLLLTVTARASGLRHCERSYWQSNARHIQVEYM